MRFGVLGPVEASADGAALEVFQRQVGDDPWTRALVRMSDGFLAQFGGDLNALGRARVVAAGMVLSAGGFALFLTIGLHTSYRAMVPAMLLSGIGMGLAMTVTADTVLASVPKDRSGAASAISETATELGGALGMAVLGSVLNAVYRGVLDLPAGVPAPAAAAARDSLGGALQAAADLPATLGAQVTAAACDAFVDGMHAALTCSAGLAVLVAVFALITLRDVPKIISDAEEPELVSAR